MKVLQKLSLMSTSMLLVSGLTASQAIVKKDVAALKAQYGTHLSAIMQYKHANKRKMAADETMVIVNSITLKGNNFTDNQRAQFKAGLVKWFNNRPALSSWLFGKADKFKDFAELKKAAKAKVKQ